MSFEFVMIEVLFYMQVNLVQQAVAADSEGKFEQAVQFYGEALEYLIPHLYSK